MNTDRCPPPEWSRDTEPEIDDANVVSLQELAPDTKRTPSVAWTSPPVANVLTKLNWTLIATFEKDGERYIVARENAGRRK